jgi:hypothetical protein
LCADGHGTLYVLTLSSTNTAELLGFYELPSSLTHSGSSLAPFRLHTASFVDGQVIAVLSFKCFDEPPPAVSSTRKIPPAEFDVVAIRIPPDTATNTTVPRPLDILWHRRGANVPLYLAYEKQRSVFILAGGSPYRRIGQPGVVHHEPSPNESAPIPNADDPSLPTEPAKPPPYAWTQDSEEVTLAFPFPSRTTTGDINVLFSPQTLTVLVQGVDFPRYAAVPLWGGISPSSSFWTWDAHGAHTTACSRCTSRSSTRGRAGRTCSTRPPRRPRSRKRSTRPSSMRFVRTSKSTPRSCRPPAPPPVALVAAEAQSRGWRG